MRTHRHVSALATAVALSFTASLVAQQPAAPAGGGQGQAAQGQAQGGRGAGAGRGGGGGGFGRGAVEPDDNTGFVEIFNGQSLDGWDGDPRYWRVEDGLIVGESTPENRVERNTFLIWRGGEVGDFELKLDFRINGTNSGIQYRSIEMPESGQWVLNGYQADLDFVNQFTGNTHSEGRGRFFLAQRGTVVRGAEDGTRKQVGTIGDATALKGFVNINGWNTYHIIARGRTIIQLVNGQLMSVFLDEDATNYAPTGVVGLQMHTGEPFRVEYRNILLKQIE